jgi:hypothetical protein
VGDVTRSVVRVSILIKNRVSATDLTSMTQPLNPPYEAFRLPDELPDEVAPIGRPPTDLVSGAQLRSEGAQYLAAASRSRLIAMLALLAAVAVSMATMVVSPGGYYLVVFGPVAYAFARFRDGASSRRRGQFFIATADLWDQGRGAGGELIARSAVLAEFHRRESKVQAKADQPLSKWVWIGALTLLALLLLLIATP